MEDVSFESKDTNLEFKNNTNMMVYSMQLFPATIM